MKPISYVIKRTAQELNIPEDQARMLINTYWDTFNKKLINLEATTLAIRNVGVFTISKRKLRCLIKKKISHIRILKKNPDRYPIDRQNKILNEQYNILKKALFHRNILANQYYIDEQRKRERRYGII